MHELAVFFKYLKDNKTIICHFIGVVSGLPGAKERRGTKHSADPSQMYNITTIGLPTTIPVHLNRYLGAWGIYMFCFVFVDKSIVKSIETGLTMHGDFR